MNANVEYLVSQILLGLQKQGGTLLEFDFESLNGIYVCDCALGDFFPQKLSVAKKQTDMTLFKSTDLHLLFELLCLQEAIHYERLSVFFRQFLILWELDWKCSLQKNDRAYSKL